MRIYPVILSGGSGTRLWPLSQPHKPKQFVPVVTDRSMIQETILRVAGQSEFLAPIIVSGESQSHLVVEQLAGIGIEPAAVLLEPAARNTAAAVAIAAHWIVTHDADALMMVMPSDHVITDLDSLYAAVRSAAQAAQAGCLVTFGIQPTHPETGYGYIERGDALADVANVHHVANFHEKPPLPLATSYFEGGQHYWNGGMFLFSARNYLSALQDHAPQVAAASAEAMDKAAVDGVTVRPQAAAFMAGPDISIDHAVMEKATNAAVVPVDMGWSDVGSWDALWAICARDEQDNGVNGDGFVIDGAGNLVYVSDGPPVAALGVRDCVIVSTAEGILVAPRDRSQDVKKIVDHLKRRGTAT
ncbi:mannose-1-phosphate guanylyltransferase/mannose-6-phosphate isomerase [Sphingobium sp. HBC34]|uniref:Mannose-1-phosphate guanylyltransferase/mannose-6-phosphate isomerase n=1 Tax=Sphingobium cyanobacteriorum TaxID=3063954 RepID=A0ABT8ZNA7_9SPHN|nr:mannose-1-phosphate guanylyltransferase/mannose-6-phosphate isomerase [Sphingobium sp. HBC34]MDO7836025.1 mannose-1-phosphate guanylyltransferase/mannose-6-phosphate isomerase [Sphingobium sp. HBC34]